MSTQLTAQQHDAIRRVVERATVNPEARQIALTDARAAVQEVGGAELPADVTVQFVERASDVDALVAMPPAGRPVEITDGSETERSLLERTLTRAQNDPAFRRLATVDARAAVKQATDFELPPYAHLAFYDQPADVDFVAVLPPLVEEGAELNEAELEMVAGGDCWITTGCIMISGGLAH